VNSADRWSDVPAGTMDEASPFRVLMPAVSLTARTRREIGPPHPPDPNHGKAQVPIPKRSEHPASEHPTSDRRSSLKALDINPPR
jgi:hypothetical protein